VIKRQFSGFYSTNLPGLLPKLGVRLLIPTGIAADICSSLRPTPIARL
jgi:nicotinamidase-related amidase